MTEVHCNKTDNQNASNKITFDRSSYKGVIRLLIMLRNTVAAVVRSYMKSHARIKEGTVVFLKIQWHFSDIDQGSTQFCCKYNM